MKGCTLFCVINDFDNKSLLHLTAQIKVDYNDDSDIVQDKF